MFKYGEGPWFISYEYKRITNNEYNEYLWLNHLKQRSIHCVRGIFGVGRSRVESRRGTCGVTGAPHIFGGQRRFWIEYSTNEVGNIKQHKIRFRNGARTTVAKQLSDLYNEYKRGITSNQVRTVGSNSMHSQPRRYDTYFGHMFDVFIFVFDVFIFAFDVFIFVFDVFTFEFDVFKFVFDVFITVFNVFTFVFDVFIFAFDVFIFVFDVFIYAFDVFIFVFDVFIFAFDVLIFVFDVFTFVFDVFIFVFDVFRFVFDVFKFEFDVFITVFNVFTFLFDVFIFVFDGLFRNIFPSSYCVRRLRIKSALHYITLRIIRAL